MIVDARLEDDPDAALRRALDGALCLGVTRPDRRADPRRRRRLARREGAPARSARSSGAAGTRRCSAASAWTEPSVDVTVQAQGEETFREILRPARSAASSLDGCLGCAYPRCRRRGRSKRRRARSATSTRSRPHDYRLLPVERYYELKGKRQLDYITSQGCVFRCAFCADPFVYKRKWVGLEPARVGEEIGTLWRRYRFDDLSFQDETYFTYADRVEAIADEFLRRELADHLGGDDARRPGRPPVRRGDGESAGAPGCGASSSASSPARRR